MPCFAIKHFGFVEYKMEYLHLNTKAFLFFSKLTFLIRPAAENLHILRMTFTAYQDGKVLQSQRCRLVVKIKCPKYPAVGRGTIKSMVEEKVMPDTTNRLL